MLLNTKHFGQIEIDEKGIIDFPEGLPGFEDVKKFVLLSNTGDNYMFQWLQSVDKPDLTFVVIDPKYIKEDYEVEVPDEEIEELELDEKSDTTILSIVVVPEDIAQMTANLKAPIIINNINKKGKQIVLDCKDYNIKHYIMQELNQRGG
ncbi:flagellar assembly protein FliW [Pseudobacteroides cellulosolvens]|uniref:Flagellar assembly factor FliW n=1 Tax=Pseudobacteroides cellulosolvens ATCC 35603 = DSM 2933 TaxID=398512 RepID=A0A0L6JSC3_9FIRM|nr:flagellar assembly protein FliW [Pseudobacteroides cellulosolvens]KNY28624.1 Flagellar assembly factor fliW [Pseudobacteroides cellulosolvens ATCC 35603 = DSM 2933]